MPRPSKVPITPSVLQWALDTSGYSPDDVATALEVERADVVGWLRGDEQPNVTNFRSLARFLRRPTAAFFLPGPPSDSVPAVEFRPAPGERRRNLRPAERMAIRGAERIRRATAALSRELGQERVDVPRVRRDADPERAARVVRDLLNVSVEQQLMWRNPSHALHEWRLALERQGILVLLLPMGSEAARGFSIWDDDTPLIAANTHWNSSARIFTLLHEVGHLVTRTSSICTERGARPSLPSTNDIERWCEQFAAAVLMPADAVDTVLSALRVAPDATITGLASPTRIANKFHVSLRAAVLRLVELRRAPKKLYAQVPPMKDAKYGGGGGAGRSRTQIRIDEFGHRVTDTMAAALRRDLIDASTAMRYLDVSYAGLGQLQALTSK